jgi:uncharacterized repeat protein (TIGR02543 family)
MLLVMLHTATTAWAATKSVSFINADGNTQTVSATVLTGNETTLAEGWYVVADDINYTSTVFASGDINLILCDGKTMSIATTNANGFRYEKNSLTIYGQNADSGILDVRNNNSTKGIDAIYVTKDITINGGHVIANSYEGSVSSAINVSTGTLTINGGIVDASTTSNNGDAICSMFVVINGGQVTAKATGSNEPCAIYPKLRLTLGCSKYTDFISLIPARGNKIPTERVKVKEGQTLYYGKVRYSGENVDLLNDDMLFRPYSPDAFSQTGTNEYTINSSYGWDLFCDALLDNDTYNRFSGMTVKLAADIETSHVAGCTYHDFCGTFDGQQHTLTFNYGKSDAYSKEEYIAPFRYVSTVTPEGGSEIPAIIKNLHVAGNIYTGAKYCGGLIGNCWGTIYIDNCRISSTITSSVSGDGTHGGLVAACEASALNIRGCLFDGQLLGTSTSCVGGFVGWRKSAAVVYNSLFAPTNVTVRKENSATFSRNQIDCYNCYYTTLLNDGSNYNPVKMSDPPKLWRNGKAARTISTSPGATASVTLIGQPTSDDCGDGYNGQYNVSGITAYSDGLSCGGKLYYGCDDQVKLLLGHDNRNGYKFNGYTVSPNILTGTQNPYTVTMPNADVNVSPSFSLITYNITYSGIDNATFNTNKYSYTVESPTITLDNPTHAHSLFCGWYDNKELTGQAVTTIETGSTGNKTFYAKWIDHVPYVDANGETKYCTDYKVLTGNETELTPGWYVVTGTLNYTKAISSTKLYSTQDPVHIILTDGATMNIGTSSSRLSGQAIFYTGDLNIYGQTLGSGSLSVYTKDNNESRSRDVIQAVSITINGGHVAVDCEGNSPNALYSSSEGVTINGGTVLLNANGTNACCIRSSGNFNYNGGILITSGNNQYSIYAIPSKSYNFSWRNPNDQVTLCSPISNFNCTANFNSVFTDGTSVYSGTLSEKTIWSLGSFDGKTLSPAVALTLAENINPVSGIASSDDVYYAKIGGTVTVGTTFPEGYACSSLSVTTATTAAVAVTDNSDGTYSFTMPAEKVTVSATMAPINYTVHFDGNGNTGGTMSDQSFTYDQAQQLTANAFSRTACTFLGWNTQADGLGTSYDDQQSVSNLVATKDGSVTLYAQWLIPTLEGDANGDGQVNVTDIMAVANHILNIPMESFDATAADVNGDVQVNVTDIMGIANIILKVDATAASRAVRKEEDTVEPQ